MIAIFRDWSFKRIEDCLLQLLEEIGRERGGRSDSIWYACPAVEERQKCVRMNACLEGDLFRLIMDRESSND